MRTFVEVFKESFVKSLSYGMWYTESYVIVILFEVRFHVDTRQSSNIACYYLLPSIIQMYLYLIIGTQDED